MDKAGRVRATGKGRPRFSTQGGFGWRKRGVDGRLETRAANSRFGIPAGDVEVILNPAGGEFADAEVFADHVNLSMATQNFGELGIRQTVALEIDVRWRNSKQPVAHGAPHHEDFRQGRITNDRDERCGKG